jgi:hypothetical protein
LLLIDFKSGTTLLSLGIDQPIEGPSSGKNRNGGGNPYYNEYCTNYVEFVRAYLHIQNKTETHLTLKGIIVEFAIIGF